MTSRIDAQKIVALDVHVHLEQPGGDTAADRQAAEYFKGGAPREPAAMADYYRSRNMAFIVFTVVTHLGPIVYGALWLLLPWPAAIGYRRFLHGVIIRSGRTRLVAYGTLLRLAGMSGTAILLYVYGTLPGAWVGAAALSAGCVTRLRIRSSPSSCGSWRTVVSRALERPPPRGSPNRAASRPGTGHASRPRTFSNARPPAGGTSGTNVDRR